MMKKILLCLFTVLVISCAQTETKTDFMPDMALKNSKDHSIETRIYNTYVELINEYSCPHNASIQKAREWLVNTHHPLEENNEDNIFATFSGTPINQKVVGDTLTPLGCVKKEK